MKEKKRLHLSASIEREATLGFISDCSTVTCLCFKALSAPMCFLIPAVAVRTSLDECLCALQLSLTLYSHHLNPVTRCSTSQIKGALI